MTEERPDPVDDGFTPFQRILRGRRSIRRFLPSPVEPEKLRACLEAARIAPSAHNQQPWRFIVVDEPDLKARIADGAFSGLYSGSRFAGKAPVLIVLLAKRSVVAHHIAGRMQRISYHLIDMGIAGEHIALQAEEFGLATCWMGWFNRRRVRRILEIPRKFQVVALMPVGYAEKRPSREPPRKTFEEVVAFNRTPAD